MTKARLRPDGLPYRVYERRGVRDYSIGYKADSGRWLFRLRCSITDRSAMVELRHQAVQKAIELHRGGPAKDTVESLIKAWFKWQDDKPATSEERRADSTLAENRREASNLVKAFGAMRTADLIKSDAYAYLDACEQAVDKNGDPRPRSAKGNKEISLMRTILEYGIRIGVVKSNPFDGVQKLKTLKTDRWVTDAELALTLRVGREMGGPQHIVALALQTAWLCVRRSVEVRAMTRDQVTKEGILWLAAKRQKGHAQKLGLIEWSDELRLVIDEALAIKRNKLAGDKYIFGNLQGQPYTKGGWKKSLSNLMVKCQEKALQEELAFQPFSLQDCRPKGVSDKLAQGDKDVMDATLHTSERMVKQVYDRRRTRVAKPTR